MVWKGLHFTFILRKYQRLFLFGWTISFLTMSLGWLRPAFYSWLEQKIFSTDVNNIVLPSLVTEDTRKIQSLSLAVTCADHIQCKPTSSGCTSRWCRPWSSCGICRYILWIHWLIEFAWEQYLLTSILHHSSGLYQRPKYCHYRTHFRFRWWLPLMFLALSVLDCQFMVLSIDAAVVNIVHFVDPWITGRSFGAMFGNQGFSPSK